MAAGGVRSGCVPVVLAEVLIVALSVDAALAIVTMLVTEPASTSAVKSGTANLL
jgi:hypothetical protein